MAHSIAGGSQLSPEFFLHAETEPSPITAASKNAIARALVMATMLIADGGGEQVGEHCRVRGEGSAPTPATPGGGPSDGEASRGDSIRIDGPLTDVIASSGERYALGVSTTSSEVLQLDEQAERHRRAERLAQMFARWEIEEVSNEPE